MISFASVTFTLSLLTFKAVGIWHDSQNFDSSFTSKSFKLKKKIFVFLSILGETSSGKSSIINLIVGEKILPTGITASTSRVCRIRYSEHMMISTCNKDETELKRMTFTNRNEMVESLSDLAQTNNSAISYVDIYFPVSMLQVTTLIICFI